MGYGQFKCTSAQQLKAMPEIESASYENHSAEPSAERSESLCLQNEFEAQQPESEAWLAQ